MITIIIPTYNESKNILTLTQELEKEMLESGRPDFEVLVMDDNSPDDTGGLVNRLGKQRVRAVNRLGRARGLSYAVIDGISQARGEWVGVMDADLSHPVRVVPHLVKALETGANLAVGSRYVPGGGIRDWPIRRCLASRLACLLARPVTSVKDSTSGFFFFRKSILNGVTLNPLGFKIGLEIFVKGQHENKIVEVPYVFEDRRAGESKLSGHVMLCYAVQLLRLIGYRLGMRK